jgi:prophage antirepressor-like protein
MTNLKLFEYEHKEIRTIFAHGEIWFVAKDTIEALGIDWNGKDSLNAVKPEWVTTMEIPDSLGRSQKTLFINESAVYKIAFRSHKPEAERFTDWIAGEVIPQIRKTGKYVPNPQGVLALSEHTDTDTQKIMSKTVNAHNNAKGGVDAIINYNVANCRAHTDKFPYQVKEFGKREGLKAKDRQSAKEVLRRLEPESACSMSLADNLVSEGFEPDRVFEVTKGAKKVFEGMLKLGATPKELKQLDKKGD